MSQSLAYDHTHKTRSEKRAEKSIAKEELTETGKAIIEGLEDIKNGRVTIIERQNLREGIRKMIDEK